jgi:hypothetical protein
LALERQTDAITRKDKVKRGGAGDSDEQNQRKNGEKEAPKHGFSL